MLGDYFGNRTRTQQTHEEVSTRTEDRDVRDDVDRKRDQHVAAGKRGGHPVARPHEPVHDPWLAPDLRCHPPRDHGDEAER